MDHLIYSHRARDIMLPATGRRRRHVPATTNAQRGSPPIRGVPLPVTHCDAQRNATMSSTIPNYETNQEKEYNMNTCGVAQSARRLTLAALAVVFAAVLASPSTSHAALGTAAGTKITNIAHVNYKDSANNPQTQVDSLAVDVTVTLVPASVNISPSITTNTVNEGTATTVTYTVFGTANGKDSYSFTSSETAGSGTISTVSGTITPFAPATLAGTSLAVATTGGEATITVPLDSSVGYAATGLVAGAPGTGTLLRIGANTYTVSAITPNVGENTMVLTLNGATLAAGTALPVGTPIGEQKTFSVSYPSGVLTGASTNIQTANATVTSTSAGNPAGTSANTVITVNVVPAVLTIDKKACTTAPAIGAPGCFAVTGSAAPGSVVLYRVVITNTGSGVAKAVVIDDIIQKYITYNPNSAKYGVGAIGTQTTKSYDGSTGALNAITDGAGGYVYAAGPPATINYAYPADLANGDELVLFYSATVN